MAKRFELSREIAGANLRAMEGMRGFAVTLVFLTHFCSQIAPSLDVQSKLAVFAAAVHTIGNTGVDLFFVLSGYLIYKTLLGRPQDFFSFMWRRIRRIYPAFLAVFAVYWVLSLVFPNESSIPADAPLLYLAENLLLLPGLFPIRPMITVAWSLSYEMFFYLCLPIVITALGLRRWSTVMRIAFIGAVAIAIAWWCSTFHDGSNDIRMIMFMAGMLLHEAINSRQARAPSGAIAACILVAGLGSILLPITGYVKFGLLFTSFYLVCMNCFVRPHEVLGRLFSWTPLRWLGNMSYSYYLLHGLTLKVLFMVISKIEVAHYPLPMFWLLLPVFFVLTLCTAAGLFLLIEKPLSLAAGSHRLPAVKRIRPDVIPDIPVSKG